MSIQENVNTYDIDAFKSSFIKTDLYKAIAKDYQYLHWEKFFDPMQPNAFHLATKSKHRKRWPNEYSLTPFYYLNFLLEKNPTTIYDLGCGDNSFKKYIPNIIGIDPDNSLENRAGIPYVDIVDTIDQSFIDSHQNYFESVFSITALHFYPNIDMKKIVNDFISMVKPGGRGYISLNVGHILNNIDKHEIWLADPTASTEKINHYFKAMQSDVRPDRTKEAVERVTRELLFDLDCTIIVFDVDYSHGSDFTSQLDGDIRIVFERNEVA